MRVFKDFHEIKAAVGAEVGVSDWVEMTQARIDRFAEATGDDQWIHVDVERAVRGADYGWFGSLEFKETSHCAFTPPQTKPGPPLLPEPERDRVPDH
jgi:hypothetical protein